MNGNFTSINTDRGLGTILSHFESEYINHLTLDFLNMRFRPFEGPMPNIVDIFERQFQNIKQNADGSYEESIDETRRSTYIEIINIICNYYNLSCTASLEDLDSVEIYFIARNIFDIFISRFTDNLVNFYIKYIKANLDSIYSYLERSEDSNKPKEIGTYDLKNYIDPKFMLIHANLNTVVYNMSSYDISLYDLIRSSTDPSIAEQLSLILLDNENIYKNFYVPFIQDARYSPLVLTSIKLQLQSDTLTMAHLINQ